MHSREAAKAGTLPNRRQHGTTPVSLKNYFLILLTTVVCN